MKYRQVRNALPFFSLPFLWGAAMSAHQVEGRNTKNDWWKWEQIKGKILDGSQSGDAADHYHRYREDFDLAQKLKHNAHRLSLEWSRIEPTPGVIDQRELQHYQEVLRALHERQLYTVVTLHHFTNPQWIAEKGGWENPETITAFERYTRIVCENLGSAIDIWITINEPLVLISMGYIRGLWPPGIKNSHRARSALRNLVSTHKAAYRMIHKYFPKAPTGIAKHFLAFLPASSCPLDRLAARLSRRIFNDYFIRRIRQEMDFIGINYYRSEKKHCCLSPKKFFACTIPQKENLSDLGWAIYPKGLLSSLRHASSWNIPIIITENGIADAADIKRPIFIKEHIEMIKRAREEGIMVCGYFYWSLIDTFEWHDGFTPKFGLIAIERGEGTRRIRESARVYAQLIEEARDW